MRFKNALQCLVLVSMLMPCAGRCTVVGNLGRSLSYEESLAVIMATAPIPADELPAVGMFYLASSGPDVPPVPGSLGHAAWDLGNGSYLIDDLSATSVTRSTGGAMRALVQSVPILPDTNTAYGNSTNPPLALPRFLTDTSVCLEMLGVTNNTAYLTTHNAANSVVYDLEMTFDLTNPNWVVLKRFLGSTTNLSVPATSDMAFYRLEVVNPVDSTGTDFWLAFMNVDNANGTSLSLNISSFDGAAGYVEIPGLGTSNSFSVDAGGVTQVSIPASAMISQLGAVSTRGVHVVSTGLVSIYGVDYSEYATSGFTGYQTPFLGTNYYIVTKEVDMTDNPNYGTELGFVATADGTEVTISIPSTAYFTGNTNTITLNRGQTYQIRETPFTRDENETDVWVDLTGARISSSVPVAVFAGTSLARVPDICTGAGNPLVQQQIPVSYWGADAMSLGFAGRANGDSYRVLAAQNSTTVYTNGNPIPAGVIANASQHLDLLISGPVAFHADNAIQVAHFANGCTFNGGGSRIGDPCEILLPSAGHYLKTNTVVFPSQFSTNYLNIMTSQASISTTRLNGSLIPSSQFQQIGSSGYYGAQIQILSGMTIGTVTSSQPVGVEAYGWGEWDAYGYLGGVSE